MSVKFKIIEPQIDDPILQGDIFKSISYIYKVMESDSYVDITELEFPYVVVISQSCDVSAMSKLVKEGGANSKIYAISPPCSNL